MPHQNDKDHKYHLSLRVVANVVIKDSRDRICVIRENRKINGEMITQWTLPGGHIEQGEHIVSGARREVQEETSLSVDIDQLLGIIDWSKPNHFGEHSGHFGIDLLLGGKYVEGTPIPQKEEKIIEVKFVDFKDIDSLQLKSSYTNAIKRYVDNCGIPLSHEELNTSNYQFLAEFV